MTKARLTQTEVLHAVADLFSSAKATTLLDMKGFLIEVFGEKDLPLGSFVYRETKDGFTISETKGACDAEFAGVEIQRALRMASRG